ncbi:MAG TPA: SDR family NAD(P)-dependent oxidoreductase [Solirubrobacteraceae bacterium]|jgi:NAD(P)-dependent dehydrogenase (short-subunit alcohol dehydrogenase family)|nr:SDR family NAD(P)-dependent oxidoreductase [Solirubrobacteraceae bacterium]
MDPSGKTFIVTGGASGLGAACVEQLTTIGANVLVADIRVEDVASSAQVRAAQTDVADDESVAAAVQGAVEAFGDLHGVINCAGISRPGRMLGRGGLQDLSVFTQTVAINLTGTFNVIRHALGYMAGNDDREGPERGVFVNTASAAAFDGQIGQSSYSASKGGVAAMTLPLARELARHRMRVNTIAPGIFETPILASLTEQARSSIASQVPYPQRLGRASEFAALAEHLLRNEMINGEVVRIDGALRLGPS